MEQLNTKRELGLTYIALTASLSISTLWVWEIGLNIQEAWSSDRVEALEIILFLSIGTGLLYGSLVFFLTRIGRFKRLQSTNYPTTQQLVQEFYTRSETPSVTVLVPSYKEELRTIEMTLFSAAAMEYPDTHVILLLDDPSSYTNPQDQKLLFKTQQLSSKIESEFRPLCEMVAKARSEFALRTANSFDVRSEAIAVAQVFEHLLRWYERKREQFCADDHVDHFYDGLVLRGGVDRMRALRNNCYALQEQDEVTVKDAIPLYYARAYAFTSVTLAVFQRKGYENLSHEPNKAMNLNSYIGLMGEKYSEQIIGEKTHLVAHEAGSVSIPNSDYLITLDADSLLASEYALRLVHHMESAGNKRLAVAQTPYNAFHCPFVNIERIAAATTDIQHLIHQGFEYYGASYWVGANALLRVKALADIKELDTERGYTISRYIQDRTVIEDTESTIDMLTKGWRVYNYLAVLAYSATPPDYGALVIQRRRWANGGLIIFPKLLRYILWGPDPLWFRLTSGFIRAHYLLSIAIVNLGVLLMILYPFTADLEVALFASAALLYFWLYARDLGQLGYGGLDVLRVYALNLLLIPVQLAGVFKSIEQLVTKEKIPFGRTPKVLDRTAAAWYFILFTWALTGYMLTGSVIDFWVGRYESAIFSAINGLFLFYACTYFIGWRHGLSDASSIRQLLRFPLQLFGKYAQQP